MSDRIFMPTTWRGKTAVLCVTCFRYCEIHPFDTKEQKMTDAPLPSPCIFHTSSWAPSASQNIGPLTWRGFLALTTSASSSSVSSAAASGRSFFSDWMNMYLPRKEARQEGAAVARLVMRPPRAGASSPIGFG